MADNELTLDQLKDQFEAYEWFCAVADPKNGLDDATADAMKRDLGSACVSALPAIISEDRRLRTELTEAIKGCEIAAEALVDFVGLAKAVRAAKPFLQRHHASQIAPHEWFSSEIAAIFDALKATE